MIGLGALALLATPGLAASDQSVTNAGAPVQVVHMGQDRGKMGPGMGTQGMMAPQGKMGPGKMGSGMMGPDTGGHGMMGPGFGNGQGLGSQVVPSKDLTADDVRHFLDHRLEMHGNKRLMVGEVKEADEDKIVADITTVDGSLVQRLEVDRHTGKMKHVE